MLAVKYALFALVSTMINLLFQYVSFTVYNGFLALYIAMFFGTLSGLLAKYILDKQYIFYHIPKDKQDDAKKFILYSFMGIFTTMIFWGTEIIFEMFLEAENARYLGAAIGLSIGYIIKYHLDKKYVFVHHCE